MHADDDVRPLADKPIHVQSMHRGWFHRRRCRIAMQCMLVLYRRTTRQMTVGRFALGRVKPTSVAVAYIESTLGRYTRTYTYMNL